MKKLVILLALGALVAFVSCGKKEESATDQMENTADQATTEATQMADSMADTAAAMADSVMGDSM